ncbi:polysaccharide pyruvyl transferase family protein [uncultured Tolumonas sp.]|uniref:polysaccharide pyruvyl transferase family protein n=1 Tax=uncultured Tolumonas sp. TaxID=263765 RepID=UPI00292E3328|nr:polysaccharide pyruvyl transferase family protein [uncultured Tolumonas sp.]
MKKKVAIVTFHKAHNYGAVLQAYALKYRINSLGFDVEFYNYYPAWMKEHYSLFYKNDNFISSFKRNIACLIDLKRRYVRFKRFSDFISKELTEWNENELLDVDFIVLGSDQIWNPNITQGFDNKCFGFLGENVKAKVISYAASMETNKLKDKDISEFTTLLNNIDSIGVREDSLMSFIKGHIPDIEIQHNLDPTLLLDNTEWNQLVTKNNTAEKYILIYENYKDEKTRKIAESIADKYGLKIKTLTADANWRYPKDFDTDAGPIEFLNLFSNASFVITTSYHGLAFSINFKKQFLTLKVKNGVNNRAESLLRSLNLLDHLIDSESFTIDSYSDIDYAKLDLTLNGLRRKSIGYLSDKLI